MPPPFAVTVRTERIIAYIGLLRQSDVRGARAPAAGGYLTPRHRGTLFVAAVDSARAAVVSSSTGGENGGSLLSEYADLVQELGMLARIPRSGLSFLGSGRQSVAEHSHRVACIALILARRCEEPVDEARLLRLCLFHDLPEARTGDQNYVHRKYVRVDEARLHDEMAAASPLGEQIVADVQEFEHGTSLEARLARDADQIEFLALLREEVDLGNPRAPEWIRSGRQRVRTEAGQQLADEVLATPSDHWWFHSKEDRHWVTGKG